MSEAADFAPPPPPSTGSQAPVGAAPPRLPQASLIETVGLVADRLAAVQTTVEALQHTVASSQHALAQLTQRLDQRIDQIQAAHERLEAVAGQQAASTDQRLDGIRDRLDTLGGQLEDTVKRVDGLSSGPSPAELRDELDRVQQATAASIAAVASQIEALSRALIG